MNVKKNLFYTVSYQILIIILPLITTPYISRILGADNIGIFSYTHSIVYYFMIISMLGINNYGSRTIAKSRDNKEELTKSFYGIYIIQLVSTLLMLFIYSIYIIFFDLEYKLISIIQGIYLLSVFMDCNWFFFGIEKFKVTVIRNTIIRFISIALIFTFVKTSSDVNIYAIIMSCSTLFSQIVLMPYLKKELISVPKLKKQDIIKHVKPCLIMFVPVVAVSIYKIMDKIMLGLLANVTEVGYYEQAEKIVNIPLSIVTALGTVMLPRISNLVSKNNIDQVRYYIKKSIEFAMFLAFPISLGIMCISNDFVSLFLGEGFNSSKVLVVTLSVTVLFISFANVIRTQFLIPFSKDKIYVKSVIYGAIINLIINLSLISRYMSFGAAIGTVVAELFVMAYQTFNVRKEIPVKLYVLQIIPFLIKSIIMFIVIYWFIN